MLPPRVAIVSHLLTRVRLLLLSVRKPLDPTLTLNSRILTIKDRTRSCLRFFKFAISLVLKKGLDTRLHLVLIKSVFALNIVLSAVQNVIRL
jgi:hypothetical protein